MELVTIPIIAALLTFPSTGARTAVESPPSHKPVPPVGTSSGMEVGGGSQADATAAPQSRAEAWRRLREDKRQRLIPYEPNAIERRMLALEDREARNLLDANFWGFYPRAQFISRGSGIGLGTRFWKPDVGGRPFDIHGSAFYSVKSYEYYDLQIGRVPHADRSLPLRSWKGDDVYELSDARLPGASRLTLYASFRYRRLPQEDYFGLGPDSSRDNHTSYSQRDGIAELVAGYKLAPWLTVTARGGLLDVDIGPGRDSGLPSIEEIFDDSTAPGLTAQPDFTHITGLVLVDTRDEPGNPQRGVAVAAAFSRFDDLDGDDFRFNRFALDARGYLPLGNPQRLVALRLLAFRDTPDGDGEVPFYLQESVGGSHTLRGFDSFRFRGESVFLAQAEYRWLAAPPVELAVFYDLGTVAAPGADLDFDKLKTNWGAGLRIKNFRSTLLRLDYARSNETSRFMFRVSSAF